MKHLLLVSAFCVLAFASVEAQKYVEYAGHDMTIVKNSAGKLGYSEFVYGDNIKTVKILIPYRFDSASEFNKAGYAVVEIAGKWGVIDKTGKTIVPIEYDYAHNVENGAAVVERGGKFGAVDLAGRLIVPLEYEHLMSFDESGLASATRWGQRGVINKSNKVVLQFDYIMASSAGEGFTRSFGTGGWKHFDAVGKEIMLVGYEPAQILAGGYLVAGKQNAPVGLFDKTGAVVLPEEYKYIQIGSNGTSAIIQKNDLEGLYDLKTKTWLIPLENDSLVFDGEKMLKVRPRENGPFYFADLSGRKIFGSDFQDAKAFDSDGFSRVKQNGKWGLIDRTGKFILPAEFEEIKVLADDRIAAKKADDPSCTPCGWGLMDFQGRIVLPFHYGKADRDFFQKPFGDLRTSAFESSSSVHKYNIIVDLRTNKPGVVDTLGGWVLKPGETYDDMKLFGASSFNKYGFLLPVKKNGKWGVYELNTRREIVTPTVLVGDIGELKDEATYGQYYNYELEGFGVVIYETGQDFKPATFSYEDYDSETKLMVVTKGKKSSTTGFTGTDAQKVAQEIVSGNTGNLKGLMRLDGTMVTKLEYSTLSFNRDAGDRYWAVKNGKGGWIDLNGRTIIPHTYDMGIANATDGTLAMADNQHYSDGYADVIYEGEVILIDMKGKIVASASDFGAPKHAHLSESDLGRTRYFMAVFGRDNQKQFKFLINGKIYESEDSISFSEDLAAVKRNGLYGYIDRAGNEVIPFIHTKARRFNSGVALVETEKEAFYINRRGERLYMIDFGVVMGRRDRKLTAILNSEVVRTIEIAEAKKAFDGGAIFVDTRSAEGFAGERIAGAINIQKATLEANIGLLPKTKKIIAYCSCPREESSSALIYELKKKGYTDVYAMRRGTPAWKAAGFPMAN